MIQWYLSPFHVVPLSGQHQVRLASPRLLRQCSGVPHQGLWCAAPRTVACLTKDCGVPHQGPWCAAPRTVVCLTKDRGVPHQGPWCASPRTVVCLTKDRGVPHQGLWCASPRTVVSESHQRSSSPPLTDLLACSVRVTGSRVAGGH